MDPSSILPQSVFPKGYPRRGEIYTVDFSPTRGSEQAGRRPAVVVSNDIGNRVGSVVMVAPITKQIPPKLYPTNALIEAGKPLPLAGVVLCHQVRTISKERLEACRGELPAETMRQVDQALREALNL